MGYPNPWRQMPEPYNQYIWQDDAHIFKLELPDLVPASANNVYAELGIGNGGLITELARLNPDDFFLGIDLYYRQLGRSARRIHREKLSNVQLLRYNANHPAILFPNHFLQGILINFPDPWPKARHHNNRIFDGPVAKHLRQILKPKKGWVFLQTDQKPYFEGACRLLEKEGFTVCQKEYPPIMPELIRSPFHSLFDSRGDVVHAVTAWV